MRLLHVLHLAATFLLVAGTTADAADSRIAVVGRSRITVTGPEIRLGDVADITSSSARDDEQVIGLQRILVMASPRPGRETTISANEILERIAGAGVRLDDLRYTLPRVITAARAGRAITPEEIRAALESAVKASGRDIELRNIAPRDVVQVSPGELTLSATPAHSAVPGRLSFALKAVVNGVNEATFNVDAIAEEWQEVPVAGRPIIRGAVISPEDVVMARLNLAAIPRDAARDGATVVGLSTSGEIGYGEVFRRNKLAVPAAIESGSRVVLAWRSGLLEATAVGVALEPGAVGERIKVRNESSKKVVVGTVLEAGLVGVSQ